VSVKAIKKQQQSKGKPHRFKKGESGNPYGRAPKGETLKDIIQDVGAQYYQNTKQGRLSYRQSLSIKMWQMALKGSIAAATWIRDTGYGKPSQMIASDPDNPIIPTNLVAKIIAAYDQRK